jgi:hypothetical protein
LLDKDLKANFPGPVNNKKAPSPYAHVEITGNPKVESRLGNLGKIRSDVLSLNVVTYKHREELFPLGPTSFVK